MYAEFLGIHSHRIDSKGRVSIPFAFREQIKPLKEQSKDVMIYCHRSLTNKRILEAGGPEWKGQLRNQFQKHVEENPYDENNEALSYGLFAQSSSLSMDKEGRIVINNFITAVLGKTKELTFVGMGASFCIWSRDYYQENEDALYQKASQARALLGKRRQGQRE